MKHFHHLTVIIIAILSLSMLYACGNSDLTQGNSFQGISPLLSSGLWDSIKGWGLFPSTSSNIAFWFFDKEIEQIFFCSSCRCYRCLSDLLFYVLQWYCR